VQAGLGLPGSLLPHQRFDLEDLLDLSKLDGQLEGAGQRAEGIYSLSVDTLRICVSRKKGERPTDWLPFRERLWAHTAHAFGYFAPAQPGNDLLPIRHSGNMKADLSLKGAALRITLDRLRVAQYPGGGTHHVLFDFYAPEKLTPCSNRQSLRSTIL
jgi:hypothetical protein